MFQQQQPLGNTNNHSPNNHHHHHHHHHHYHDEKVGDGLGSAKFGDYELSSGNPFDISQTKNASLETIKQWRASKGQKTCIKISTQTDEPEPSQAVIDPNSLGETSVQPAPSKTVINLDSLRETSVQPPPPQTVIDPKSLGESLVQPPPSHPIVDQERPPNPINWAVEWQNTILTLCFTTAIGIAIQSMGKEFQFPPSFHWLSLANSLTFSTLFVAKFIGRKSPVAVKVLEQVAVFLAATVFFLAVTIPLPPHFKYAAWAIYAVTMIIVSYAQFCNFFEDTKFLLLGK